LLGGFDLELLIFSHSRRYNFDDWVNHYCCQRNEIIVQLTAYDQPALFDHLRSEWNILLQNSMSNRIFSTREWLSTWWDAYHPGELWVIACRDENGHLIGLAPWFIEQHPLHGRVVRSIGCIEVTDYLDVVIDINRVDEVLNCFATYMAQHRDRFDVIDLCNLPEASPTHFRFPDILSRHGFQVTIKQQEVCPVIHLPSDWESYLALLDKKQRHELRRKMRRADGAAEALDWYIVDASHDFTAETDRFLALMASSHEQKALFLQDAQNLTFFKKIIPVAHDNGWLQLSFLTIDGQAAASYLNFVYGDRVSVYNSGLLPDQFGHLSPGIILLAYNVQHAIESGYKVFDFLRGNEIYKYRMGGQDTGVFMLRAQ
jgi:CelD/BcsL family acetyltransferase involved in cellulose biosynthesis